MAAIICCTLLVVLDKLEPGRFMEVLMLLLGAVFGISVGYALGYMKGRGV